MTELNLTGQPLCRHVIVIIQSQKNATFLMHNFTHGSLWHFSTASRKKVRKIHLPNQNAYGINECFLIDLFNILVFHDTMFPRIAQLHCSRYKSHTTHNSLIRSDAGLTLETSAVEYLYGGKITSS